MDRMNISSALSSNLKPVSSQVEDYKRPASNALVSPPRVVKKPHITYEKAQQLDMEVDRSLEKREIRTFDSIDEYERTAIDNIKRLTLPPSQNMMPVDLESTTYCHHIIGNDKDVQAQEQQRLFYEMISVLKKLLWEKFTNYL